MTGLLIALAGGLGAGARFVLDGVITRRTRGSVPVATLCINVLGSFLLGLLTGLVARHGTPESARLVLGVGFLGGFTTFSTASVELVRLARGGRRLVAVGLAVTMLTASVLAALVGMLLV